MVAIENIFLKYIKLRSKLDKGKIYKITDNTNDNKYIGSTCKTLKYRLSKHECDYKRFLKGIFNNVTSFDIIKNNNYKIELLENCVVKTKKELLKRERLYIENNQCVNRCVPGRTNKEYHEANKDQIKEYQKEYKEANKKKIREQQKEYRKANRDKFNEKFDCSCGGYYTYIHKARHEKSTKHQNYLKSQNK